MDSHSTHRAHSCHIRSGLDASDRREGGCRRHGRYLLSHPSSCQPVGLGSRPGLVDPHCDGQPVRGGSMGIRPVVRHAVPARLGLRWISGSELVVSSGFHQSRPGSPDATSTDVLLQPAASVVSDDESHDLCRLDASHKLPLAGTHRRRRWKNLQGRTAAARRKPDDLQQRRSAGEPALTEMAANPSIHFPFSTAPQTHAIVWRRESFPARR